MVKGKEVNLALQLTDDEVVNYLGGLRRVKSTAHCWL
ncbi:MAG: iron-sulfur cluster assembly scaffold protein [Actinobacteria bacterium]|nr:iron-sulfur cluster assembly scaffold protein [Actinomycetota bacterium]